MKESIRSKVTLLNMISMFIFQIITLINGFIIPKIILSYFGSDINGLVSSINQFLNYIALIEGGLTGVVVASLYKPIADHDYEKVSAILYSSKKFYKNISIIFIIYTLLLAIVYPLLFHINYSYTYVFSLIIILSISLFVQYMFSLNYKNLLTADKKVYIVSFTQSIILILNIVLSFISVKIFPSIHLLKLVSGLLFIFQPLFFNIYVKRHYPIIKNKKGDKELIKSRWNGFAINIAAFIHYGTDITLLTIFTNYSVVSIYSVYSLVSNGLRQVISSLTNGINPTIGNLYASGNSKKFLFSVGALLITPFVMIYTLNINDVNYYQPLFGYLLLVSEALYLLKFPHLNLAYSANKFKEITKPAFIEATINIVISLFLVNILGLEGITIGTIIAMMYRLMFHIRYTKTLLNNRNVNMYYYKIAVFTAFTLIGFLICTLLPLRMLDIFNWICYGILYSIIFIILYSICSFFFFKNEFSYLKNYLCNKGKGD